MADCANQMIRNSERFASEPKGKGKSGFFGSYNNSQQQQNFGGGKGFASYNNDMGFGGQQPATQNYMPNKVTFYESKIIDARALKQRAAAQRMSEDRSCEFACFGTHLVGLSDMIRNQQAGLIAIPLGRKFLPSLQRLQILQSFLTVNMTDEQFINMIKGWIQIMDFLGIEKESVENMLAESKQIESSWKEELDAEIAAQRLPTREHLHEKYSPASRTPLYFNISSYEDYPRDVFMQQSESSSNVNALIEQFETQVKSTRKSSPRPGVRPPRARENQSPANPPGDFGTGATSGSSSPASGIPQTFAPGHHSPLHSAPLNSASSSCPPPTQIWGPPPPPSLVRHQPDESQTTVSSTLPFDPQVPGANTNVRNNTDVFSPQPLQRQRPRTVSVSNDVRSDLAGALQTAAPSADDENEA